jgi:2',3'-cyclic-nucleotide 2'-phosphodiesterase (5'-nucleotidase family)
MVNAMSMNPIDNNRINDPYQGHHHHGKKHHNKYEKYSDPRDSVTIQRYDNGQRFQKVNEELFSQQPETSSPEIAADQAPSSPPPSKEGRTTITIISTNDQHGYFKSMADQAGLIAALKKEHPDAILVDVGDVAYNPPFSDQHHYEPMVDIMNHVGYNVVGLGNHEFQWGAPTMKEEYVDKIKADVVCANIKDPQTNDYLPGVKPYVIKEINGVKVGILGLVTPGMSTSAHPNVGKDVKKLDMEDTARSLIPEMKAKGAEVIVVLSHHGIHAGADPDMAKNVQGIDVVFSAHDHQLTSEPIVINKFPSKTYVFQGQSHAKYVGETTIDVDSKTHKVIEVQCKAIPTRSYTSKPDPEVQKMVSDYLRDAR